MTSDLIEHFSSLKDPRIERNKSHALIDIVVPAICAVASGADGWEGIEPVGRNKIDWLRQYVPLANGIPSHDCISDVLSRVSPTGFRECFMSWTQSVMQQTGNSRRLGWSEAKSQLSDVWDENRS